MPRRGLLRPPAGRARCDAAGRGRVRAPRRGSASALVFDEQGLRGAPASTRRVPRPPPGLRRALRLEGAALRAGPAEPRRGGARLRRRLRGRTRDRAGGRVRPRAPPAPGNAKGDGDIGGALAAGVGLIVIDNGDDVDRLVRLGASGQRVLVRVNPAVPGQTHAAVDTGSAEAKFGVPLGQAPALLERVAGLDGLELLGLHVHIGSQLLDLDGFGRAAEAIAALGRFGVYDLGGGLGISYTPDERAPSVGGLRRGDGRRPARPPRPAARLIVEPGRSMVGRSGVTLYEVVTVKRGADAVAVDGGMGDNLEPMLYGTRFAAAIVDRERPAERVRPRRAPLRERRRARRGVDLATPEVGDLVVLAATGAYCYSLMNNYNGARRPPVVLVARRRRATRRPARGDGRPARAATCSNARRYIVSGAPTPSRSSALRDRPLRHDAQPQAQVLDAPRASSRRPGSRGRTRVKSARARARRRRSGAARGGRRPRRPPRGRRAACVTSSRSDSCSSSGCAPCARAPRRRAPPRPCASTEWIRACAYWT